MRLAISALAALLASCADPPPTVGTERPFEAVRMVFYDGSVVRVTLSANDKTNSQTIVLTRDATLELHKQLTDMLKKVGPDREQSGATSL